MAETLKVRKIDGALGVLLLEALAAELSLHEGDDVFVSVRRDGIHISFHDPDFTEALDDARDFMRTHRDTFQQLAR